MAVSKNYYECDPFIPRERPSFANYKISLVAKLHKGHPVCINSLVYVAFTPYRLADAFGELLK